MSTIKVALLIYLSISVLFTIAWCLSGIGTPDDHELDFEERRAQYLRGGIHLLPPVKADPNVLPPSAAIRLPEEDDQ